MLGRRMSGMLYDWMNRDNETKPNLSKQGSLVWGWAQKNWNPTTVRQIKPNPSYNDIPTINLK